MRAVAVRAPVRRALLQTSSRTPLETELADLLDALYAAPPARRRRTHRAAEMFAALLRRRGTSRRGPWSSRTCTSPTPRRSTSCSSSRTRGRCTRRSSSSPCGPYRTGPARRRRRRLDARRGPAPGAAAAERRATVELASTSSGAPLGRPCAARSRRRAATRGSSRTSCGPRASSGVLVTVDGIHDATGLGLARSSRRGGAPAARVPRQRRAAPARAGVRAGHVVRDDRSRPAGAGARRGLLADPAARSGGRRRPRARRPAGVRARPGAGGPLQRAGRPTTGARLHARAAVALREAGAPAQIVSAHLDRAR